MKSLFPAIVVLGLAMGGLVGALFVPGSNATSHAESADILEAQAPKSVVDQLDRSRAKVDQVDRSQKSTSRDISSAVPPMTACNALGTPIPVISDQSALHDPKIVQKLKARAPADAKRNLKVDAPKSLPADLAEKTKGMVWIPGGVSIMGSDAGPPDEEPPHVVTIDGFWMDATEVTNRQFKAFVDATDYVTLPERKPELRSLQGKLKDVRILDEFNLPGSICGRHLSSLDEIDPAKGAYSWWQYLPGANWKHPEGPGSSIEDRMDHPVVHVSWLDAIEYCKWAGKQLPTEAQWEYAARGGHDGNIYPWGNERTPNGQWKQNIWQGTFPITDTGADGYKTTAPVATFAANDFGLYDMSGNVWEWCADYYQPEYYYHSPVRNPPGPDSSFDPQEPGIIKRVQRGGSFMCSDEYCVGYRVSARMKGEEDTGAFHSGFRCVVLP